MVLLLTRNVIVDDTSHSAHTIGLVTQACDAYPTNETYSSFSAQSVPAYNFDASQWKQVKQRLHKIQQNLFPLLVHMALAPIHLSYWHCPLVGYWHLNDRMLSFVESFTMYRLEASALLLYWSVPLCITISFFFRIVCGMIMMDSNARNVRSEQWRSEQWFLILGLHVVSISIAVIIDPIVDTFILQEPRIIPLLPTILQKCCNHILKFLCHLQCESVRWLLIYRKQRQLQFRKSVNTAVISSIAKVVGNGVPKEICVLIVDHTFHWEVEILKMEIRKARSVVFPYEGPLSPEHLPENWGPVCAELIDKRGWKHESNAVMLT